MKTRLLTPEELADAMRDYPRPLTQSRPVIALFAVTVAAAIIFAAMTHFDPMARVAACAVSQQ